MTTQDKPSGTADAENGPPPENMVERQIMAADQAFEAARAAGKANALAWIRLAARELRAVLPTAHTLLVETESWASDRGGARPAIRAVRDEHGVGLWDEGDTSAEGVALSELINEVCTRLDTALRFCDPWLAPGWDRADGGSGTTYTVTLPHGEVHDLVWEKDADSGVERARSTRYATPRDAYYVLTPTTLGVAGLVRTWALTLALVYDGGVTHDVPMSTFVAPELAKGDAQMWERRGSHPG